jgi:uroporphyrinogen-III synthase
LNEAQSKFTHVLITRPRVEAERLASLLASLQIDTIVLPAQAFHQRTLDEQEREALEQIDAPALLVFTSPRSVDLGLPQLPASLLELAKIAAIGPATAKSLQAAGKRVDFEPEDGYTSEDLLDALKREAAPAGGQVKPQALILCAPGGREVLMERLGECGWAARPLWVYEREAAPVDKQALESIDQAGRLLTVFTSAEAMNTLSKRLPTAAWYAICRGEWLVISERLKRLARAFGPPAVHLAKGPENADLAPAIRSLR